MILFTIAAVFTGFTIMIRKNNNAGSTNTGPAQTQTQNSKWCQSWWLLFLIISGALVFTVSFIAVPTLREGLAVSIGFSVREIQIGLAILAGFISFGLWCRLNKVQWSVERIAIGWLVVLIILLLSTWAWQFFKEQAWSWVAISATDWKNPWIIGAGVAILLLFILWLVRKNTAIMAILVILTIVWAINSISYWVLNAPIDQNAIQRQQRDQLLSSQRAPAQQITVTVRPDEPVKVDWPNDSQWNYQTFSTPRPTRLLFWKQEQEPTPEQCPTGVMGKFGEDPSGIPENRNPIWFVAEDDVSFELVVTFSHR